MYGKLKQHLASELAAIREAGLYKDERLICSPQRAEIEVGGKPVTFPAFQGVKLRYRR